MQKHFIPILIMTAMVLLAAQGPLWAQDNRAKLLKGTESKPIDIVSDRLDAYREKDLVQFSGNVVATQGDRVIKSDTLELYFKKKAEGTGRLQAMPQRQGTSTGSWRRGTCASPKMSAS